MRKEEEVSKFKFAGNIKITDKEIFLESFNSNLKDLIQDGEYWATILIYERE